MQIRNPNVLQLGVGNPTPIVVGDVAAAGTTGDVSDAGHGHLVQNIQFFREIFSTDVEGSTNSLTAEEILVMSGFSIPKTDPFIVVLSMRKSAGAAATASIGLALNSTVVAEADLATNNLWFSTGANEAQNGLVVFYVGAHDATYGRPVARMYGGTTTWSSAHLKVDNADIPDTTLSAVRIRGIVSNVLITCAVNFGRIYEFPSVTRD